MKKIRAAIVGYGNIGQYVLNSLKESKDFEIAGIVRRSTGNLPLELTAYKIVTSLGELDNVDVAILCSPSRLVEKQAIEALGRGICTVDSFDIHSEIVAYRRRLSECAKKNNKASIIAAGWDPGTDSIVRSVMLMSAPKGITYTNFGPGMSMGHTVAVKAIEGVKNALSMTIPIGTSIHRRMVYVELEDGYNLEDVSKAIKQDAYFIKDETYVNQVESIKDIQDMGHGTNIVRKGVSGSTHNQTFEFNMSIHNPALTAEILVSSARAVVLQNSGAYTLIEIPLIDFLYGDREKLIEDIV